MEEKRYILKKGDYYLADIMVDDNQLVNFAVDRDYRKLYAEFDLAEEDRKLIYIETGLAFEVKIFRKEEN